jgi:bifunctional non-homologous end joining protein LigD
VAINQKPETTSPTGAAPKSRTKSPTGRRVSKHPLIEIGRAKKKKDALAGVERWKARHPEAAAHLSPEDVLTDQMRGRSSAWYRTRVNLQHVPEELRPQQEALDPDEQNLTGWEGM